MIQNSRKSHAALRQQPLDNPLFLDGPGIFGRVELKVFLSRCSIGFWLVEFRWPDDFAVELVDVGSPRVRTDCIRVARVRRATPGIGLRLRLPGCKYLLRRRLHVHRGLGSGTLEPRVGLRPPTTRNVIGSEALPDDTADIRVVDRAAEGGLEVGERNGTGVVFRGQPDGLGDKSIIPNRVKVCLQ